jgi:hypothetical protein
MISMADTEEMAIKYKLLSIKEQLDVMNVVDV